MSPREKMARAICCPDASIRDEVWAGRSPGSRYKHMIQAKAALQSLLPPDEGTVEAMLHAHATGAPFDSPFGQKGSLATIFTAAIQHILKEDA